MDFNELCNMLDIPFPFSEDPEGRDLLSRLRVGKIKEADLEK